MTLVRDRRRHRSDHPAEALTLQLDAVRRRADLDAIALADDDGLLVAHAGDPERCAELGAAAPLMERTYAIRDLVPPDTGLHVVRAGGATLRLLGSGGHLLRDVALAEAARGVARILGS